MRRDFPVSSALRTLNVLEERMMNAKDRIAGVRAAIALAKYCGALGQQLSMTPDVPHHHADSVNDAIASAMRRVHGALGCPIVVSNQLDLFEMPR